MREQKYLKNVLKSNTSVNGSFTNPHQFGIVEKIATNSSSACINILPFFQQCLLTVVQQWGNNAYLMEYVSFTSQGNICIHHKHVNVYSNHKYKIIYTK